MVDFAPVSSLYELSRTEVGDLVASLGEPAYRAGQIWAWLYRHLARDISEMTTLSAALRARIAESHGLHTMELVRQTLSDDSLAKKYLFRLADGQLVETVLMHYVDAADETHDARGADALHPNVPGELPSAAQMRHTVCLSTQVGCAMGCVFCATGQMGLVRDLSVGECMEQLVWAARELAAREERLTNVVFMGMGEPLANWPATSETVRRLHDPEAFGLGARRITISTVGIVPGIRRLAESDLPVRLAVSLHAADDELRQSLVPVNNVYGLDAILEACRDYVHTTGRRVTFEYVLIQRVNDELQQARALARRLKGLDSHVNLIPLNPTEGSDLAPSSYARAVAFQEVLRQAGISTTLRQRRGIEIQAGCGQLRSRDVAGRVGRGIAAAVTAPA